MRTTLPPLASRAGHSRRDEQPDSEIGVASGRNSPLLPLLVETDPIQGRLRSERDSRLRKILEVIQIGRVSRLNRFRDVKLGTSIRLLTVWVSDLSRNIKNTES